MARPLRPQVAGGVYHLTTRGVLAGPVFRTVEDRTIFLGLLDDVVQRQGWACHGYCLMTTHYHLLIRTPDPDLGCGMKWLNGVYAQGVNRRHRSRGHVFESRYESVLVEREPHLLELFRYVVRNPVRAGICAKPEDWSWSSYPRRPRPGPPSPLPHRRLAPGAVRGRPEAGAAPLPDVRGGRARLTGTLS